MVPEGIRTTTWKDFLKDHRRVSYRHMRSADNLKKSIVNDKNQIEFLKSYRDQTRQQLTLPHHIDFRSGGPFNRDISKEYGKPYDTIFMRMISWAPSSQKQHAWEVYIPGSTIKGAFHKRASQLLKTLWGETKKNRDHARPAFRSTEAARSGLFFRCLFIMMTQIVHGAPWTVSA